MLTDKCLRQFNCGWTVRGFKVLVTVADSSWVIFKMSVFIRLNVSSQISVTGFCTDFATMLNGGGDVHFRVYPSV